MADQDDGAQRGNDRASSSAGVLALRARLGEMITDAARARMPWIVIGGLVLAFLLTFVLAPLLSLAVAAFVGAAAHAVLSRFGSRGGAIAERGDNRRLGAMLPLDVRKHRQAPDLIAEFSAVAGLAMLALGAGLAFAGHEIVLAIVLAAVFGSLVVLLVRR